MPYMDVLPLEYSKPACTVPIVVSCYKILSVNNSFISLINFVYDESTLLQFPLAVPLKALKFVVVLILFYNM